MQTRKYVCCSCRLTAHRKSWSAYGPVRCQGCGEPMSCVGAYFRTPKKRDRRGWERVKQQVRWLFRRYYLTYEERVRLSREGMFKR